MKNFAWIVAILSLSFLAPVRAAEFSFAFPDSFDGSGVESRKLVAETLLQQVGALKGLIPAPGDEDRKWIAGELEYLQQHTRAGDYQVRVSNLYNSPRYQDAQLYDLLATIEQNLHCALDGGGAEEMYCWTRASYLMLDSTLINTALQILGSRQAIDPLRFKPAMESVPIIFALNGRTILDRIISPHLKAADGP